MNAPIQLPETSDSPMHPNEFLAFVASIMALGALSVDAMLPALGAMAASYDLIAANDRQWIISTFLIGIAAGSLLIGPLADTFGRRPVILLTLIGFVASAALTIFVDSFEILLLLRLCAGACSGGLRVTVTAAIRDRFEGDAMARIISLAFMVFLLVPMVAPFIGYSILQVADWPWIFVLLAVMGGVMLVWSLLRLPETLRPENAVPLSLGDMLVAAKAVALHRNATCYILAVAVISSPLYGFLTSAQQIFQDVFARPEVFPAAFAMISLCLAAAAFVNARFVETFGARRIAHIALLIMLAVSVVMVGRLALQGEHMLYFAVGTAFCVGLLSFVGSNASSIAMRPFGAMAGTASSFQGFVTGIVAAGLGAVIGQLFDGTTLPLTLSFLVAALIALILVLIAENGKLMPRKQQGTA